MKVAQVAYTGPMQSKNVTGPSGESYNLQHPMGGDPIPVDVHSLEDMEFFERNDSVYDIEWTAQGELAKRTAGPVTNAKEVLEDIAYHQKRSLVSTFNLDPESQSEDDIDEVLEDEIETLEKQMTTQR